MTIKDIEKEMNDIPLELRQLRSQKSEIETQIRNLFNEKMALGEEILKFKKNRDIAAQDLAQARSKVSEENTKAKKVIADSDQALYKLKAKEAELDRRDAAVREAENRNSKDRENILRENSNIKIKVQSLQDKNRNLDVEIKKHQELIAENKKIQDDLNAQLAEQKKLNLDAEDTNTQLHIGVSEAKAVKADYEAKIQEQKAIADALNQRIRESEALNKALQAKIDEEEKLKADLAKAINEADIRSRSFEKMSEELGNERKKLEILDLRIQKLAKDQGLQKELEQLKKSLE